MAFKDDVLTILTGGLPALADGGIVAPQQTIPVEATPPEPQLQDREPFNLSGFNLPQGAMLGIGAAVVALVAIFAFARR